MIGWLLSPIYRWVWGDANGRARRLLTFAEVEADGGRDIARAAELTGDPLLRRLFLAHALDEGRHADLFRSRGLALLKESAGSAPALSSAAWLAPGERGFDDVQVEAGREDALLAFLHLSERTAARDFAAYHAVLDHDPATRDVFEKVLRDEEFHMKYTYAQLGRVAPRRRGWLLWRARGGRLWKSYLRFAAALAGLLGGVILTLQYFILLPPFALLARRAARREASGWSPVQARGPQSMKSQF